MVGVIVKVLAVMPIKEMVMQLLALLLTVENGDIFPFIFNFVSLSSLSKNWLML